MAIDKLIRPRGLTTDIIVFTLEDEKLKIMLIKRASEPFLGSWALPGSFLRDNEGSKGAALRTLKEKAGVINVYLEQLYTFDGSERDPRGKICTITYFALVPPKKTILEKSGKNIQTPSFFPINKLPKLAFDHKSIINYAAKRLQSKLEYTIYFI